MRWHHLEKGLANGLSGDAKKKEMEGIGLWFSGLRAIKFSLMRISHNSNKSPHGTEKTTRLCISKKSLRAGKETNEFVQAGITVTKAMCFKIRSSTRSDTKLCISPLERAGKRRRRT